MVVVSNDTDTVILLLYYIESFKQQSLTELWVQFRTGNIRYMLPLHALFLKLGEELYKVLIKAHVLNWDDALSKIGKKHAAIACKPTRYLSGFGESIGESIVLSESDLNQVGKWSFSCMGWSKE